ncbi:hypothetical protein JAO29_07600 [Edaphobacter sp. HDX4]|uniref:hypothetical protein n=1 Tax=Edaphobacter sp. HDX4 TaxID=2794064 RepID=UPI002FE699EB
MMSFGKVVLTMVLTCLVSAIPVSAQITNGLDFTTSFPFYVGNAQMPAGSYMVTQSDMDDTILIIRNDDGSHAALIDFTPTQSDTYHANSDVTFHKYGNTEYLNRLWVEGQQYGMKVVPTKAESKLAAATNTVEHSLAANKLSGKGEAAAVAPH